MAKPMVSADLYGTGSIRFGQSLSAAVPDDEVLPRLRARTKGAGATEKLFGKFYIIVFTLNVPD